MKETKSIRQQVKSLAEKCANDLKKSGHLVNIQELGWNKFQVSAFSRKDSFSSFVRVFSKKDL